ncbi:hypothetical protein PCASD_26243 [Puccinia coronata f. sp. avenae]|uniref:4a-hydroxytetrahydrobiopterin dehydratase n=1 Tax=Puccinia coronata f. sp. avenae TaxID=200324 RepID=A0A2N5RXD9_9BASI|nr:hypothetical protein PCASD_26243 [Puccinia coronata f. sp. avenae]
MGGSSSSSSSRRDGTAVWKTARYSTSPDDHHPTSSRPTKLYTTRASVEEALKSSRYAALAASGWRVVHPHDHPLPLVALQKQFHPRLPFRSWNHILDWLHLHLRPVTDELDHHPDISISNFNHLTLTLFTHSLNALTPRDFRLALRIDRIIPPNPRP